MASFRTGCSGSRPSLSMPIAGSSRAAVYSMTVPNIWGSSPPYSSYKYQSLVDHLEDLLHLTNVKEHRSCSVTWHLYGTMKTRRRARPPGVSLSDIVCVIRPSGG